MLNAACCATRKSCTTGSMLSSLSLAEKSCVIVHISAQTRDTSGQCITCHDPRSQAEGVQQQEKGLYL